MASLTRTGTGGLPVPSRSRELEPRISIAGLFDGSTRRCSATPFVPAELTDNVADGSGLQGTLQDRQRLTPSRPLDLAVRRPMLADKDDLNRPVQLSHTGKEQFPTARPE